MKIRKNIALSDTGFLFNPSTGDSYSLNPMGQQIVKYIQDNKSDEEIIELITEEYMVDNSSVEKDLYDFKQMLDNYKLSE
jgi:hypothetical protein